MDFGSITNTIKNLKTDLYGDDFLLTWDKTKEELEQTLYVAEALKYLYENNISTKCFVIVSPSPVPPCRLSAGCCRRTRSRSRPTRSQKRRLP